MQVIYQEKVKEYTYDAQGNWTKVIYLGNDEPTMVKERVIEYYGRITNKINPWS